MEQPAEYGREQATDDSCAGDEGGDQTGDPVCVRVAPQLEQVGLQSVEDVDLDAAGEEAGQHQGPNRRHPQPVVDRIPKDCPHLGEGLVTPLRGKSEVVHHDQREDEDHHQDGGPHDIGDTEIGDLSKVAAGDRTGQHGDAGDHLGAGEDPLEHAVESGRGRARRPARPRWRRRKR